MVTMTVFGQPKGNPKPATIDPKFLKNITKIDPSTIAPITLSQERIPFFNNWVERIKCSDSYKFMGFQITFIDTKDATSTGCSNIDDANKTYYYSGALDFVNLKAFPTTIKLAGDINYVWNNNPYTFYPKKFNLAISTVRPIGTTAATNDLTITIDGVGTIPMKYQTMGNHTLYANNGKQIVIISLSWLEYTIN
jgi:hypothetical protein